MTDDDQPAPLEPALDRRDLFRCATFVAAAALPACGKREEPRPAPARPPAAATPAPPAPPPSPAAAYTGENAPAVELVELSIADLQLRMKAGSDTAKSLVAKYRQRI